MSTDVPEPGSAIPQQSAAELSREHLYLACAIIRGALSHLGVDCAVSADASNLPACDFTIVTKQ